MIDTSSISIWLAVIAAASLLQSVMLFGLAFAVWRSVRQGRETLDRWEAQHLVPLVARVNAALDDVHHLTARVRAVDGTLSSATDTVVRTALRAKATAWPALAFGRAAWDAVSSFRRRRSFGRPSSAG